jgi:hypothetical protein
MKRKVQLDTLKKKKKSNKKKDKTKTYRSRKIRKRSPTSVRIHKDFQHARFRGIYCCYLIINCLCWPQLISSSSSSTKSKSSKFSTSKKQVSERKRQVKFYVGISNDAKHRLRRHNRELANGARLTAGGQWKLIGVVGWFYSFGAAESFEKSVKISYRKCYSKFKTNNTTSTSTSITRTRTTQTSQMQMKIMLSRFKKQPFYNDKAFINRMQAFHNIMNHHKRWKHKQLSFMNVY